MHWGHSVSHDLVHWEEWPIALFPDASGQCYSGTATLVRTRGANVAEIEHVSANNRFAYAPAILVGALAAALRF